MSQLDLETEIGAASGVISRVESNTVNPTKETIIKIARVLDLNNWEIDYLIGQSVIPATWNEIERAKIEASQYLNQRGRFSYLLDDRWRFFMISNAFLKLLKIGEAELKYIIGKTTVEIITKQDSPAIGWVDKGMYEDLLRMYLPIYYSRMSHMEDDEIYQRTLDSIERNPKARKIWVEIISKGNRKFALQEERVIPFNILGFRFNMYYAWNELPVNSRFEIVEYYADSKILNTLKKFI